VRAQERRQVLADLGLLRVPAVQFGEVQLEEAGQRGARIRRGGHQPGRVLGGPRLQRPDVGLTAEVALHQIEDFRIRHHGG
jgi:hypothetical protein